MEERTEERAVSFLGRMFGREASHPAPSYATRHAGASAADLKPFVDELILIGGTDGFVSFTPGGRFNPQGRNIRAREIGMRLNMMGGSTLMRRVYDRVQCPNARQLAGAWDEIGDWTA
jgi:hypothetical protein